MRKLIAGAALLLVTAFVPQAQAGDIADKATMDKTLSGFVEAGRASGASGLVFVDGKEVYFGAFGKADGKTGQEMKRDTLVRIYSMTKPITGVALMTLYEKGLFKFDDPIAKYVPELADLKLYAGEDANGSPILTEPDRQPTVLDMLRHTAGLAVGDGSPTGDLYRAAMVRDIDIDLTETMKRLGTVPLLYNPGTRWLYSDAVDVQAIMVERLSGKPFDQYLQEVIFDPLRMSETGYYVAPERRNRLARINNRHDEGPVTPAEDDEHGVVFNLGHHKLTPGSWGLTSTVDDYMKFAQMLVHGGELGGVRILKPETIKVMATNYLADSITERSWLPSKGQVGFGVDFAVRVAPPANDAENYGVPGEFFWDGYASTLFWVDPKTKLTAVMFVQVAPFDNSLHKDYRDAVYGVTHRGATE